MAASLRSRGQSHRPWHHALASCNGILAGAVTVSVPLLGSATPEAGAVGALGAVVLVGSLGRLLGTAPYRTLRRLGGDPDKARNRAFWLVLAVLLVVQLVQAIRRHTDGGELPTLVMSALAPVLLIAHSVVAGRDVRSAKAAVKTFHGQDFTGAVPPAVGGKSSKSSGGLSSLQSGSRPEPDESAWCGDFAVHNIIDEEAPGPAAEDRVPWRPKPAPAVAPAAVSRPSSGKSAEQSTRAPSLADQERPDLPVVLTLQRASAGEQWGFVWDPDAMEKFERVLDTVRAFSPAARWNTAQPAQAVRPGMMLVWANGKSAYEQITKELRSTSVVLGFALPEGMELPSQEDSGRLKRQDHAPAEPAPAEPEPADQEVQGSGIQVGLDLLEPDPVADAGPGAEPAAPAPAPAPQPQPPAGPAPPRPRPGYARPEASAAPPAAASGKDWSGAKVPGGIEISFSRQKNADQWGFVWQPDCLEKDERVVQEVRFIAKEWNAQCDADLRILPGDKLRAVNGVRVGDDKAFILHGKELRRLAIKLEFARD